MHNHDFVAGDIFFTMEEGLYQPYKLLKADEHDTWHVMGFAPVEQQPAPEDVDAFEIHIYHFPIDKNGFENPVFLANRPVAGEDLIGYHEYVRQTHEDDEIVSVAYEYYVRANALADQKEYQAAIQEYSNAIDLVPAFYEAIDNRGLTKMDIGDWSGAMEDFRLSLSVHPGNTLAEFSIGECFWRLGNNEDARKQFEKVLEIDPNDQLAKDFLKNVQ